MFWLWARRRKNESRERKVDLDRMAAMLSRLGKRGYAVQEESSSYGIDPDFDSDFDPDETNSQQIPNKTVLDNRLPAPSPNDFGNHNP